MVLLRPVAIGLIAASCALPLGWLVWQIAADPQVLRYLQPGRIRWDILGRTTGYAAIAAILAVLLAVPVGLALSRRGLLSRLLAVAAPATLLLPSMIYTYGWAQLIRLISLPAGQWLSSLGVSSDMLLKMGVRINETDRGPAMLLVPAGPADVARCIAGLAAWLWPIPAMAIAAALRRADPDVQLQARLDGAAGRITARQMLAPAAIGALAVWLLAGQEFAVYEPTGISVVATEVRQIFETGSFSSPNNPITQPMIGGGEWVGGDRSTGGDAGIPAPAMMPSPDDLQARAAAAAVATAVPMLLLTLLVGGGVAYLAGRWSHAAGDELTDGSRQASPLPASRGGTLLATTIVLATLGIPILALVLRHQRSFDPVYMWEQFHPPVMGSLLVAGLAGLAVIPIAWDGLRRRSRWMPMLAIAVFLVGGQLLAIAIIRLYNRPQLGWIYNAPPILIFAYLGRFAWLPMLAAGMTWSRPWQRLREQAATDGADRTATARWIIGPLAWPLVAGSVMLLVVLSSTEVPATVLATPHRPPQIVPMLMTWVHTLDSDPMIEASLLLAVVAATLAVLAIGLVSLGLRRVRRAGSIVGLVVVTLAATGCSDPKQPKAIWLNTGTGPGQTVYPRAIDYNKTDDTFVVIDRVGRVQRLKGDGTYLSEWPMPLTQSGKPVGVSFGPDGNIYVPDTHYHRVMVYSPQGELLRQWGSEGRGPGQFVFPTDIAFDRAGRVFVAEYGDNDRVQVFDAAGKYLFHFGRFGDKDGELSRPQSLVILDDLVYITDACNHRIAVFRTDGSFVRNMGGVGSDLGQFRFPYGLALDKESRLIVCEFGNNRVQQVDRETGKGLKSWGSAGRQPGQLAYPWAVAVTGKGQIAVIDAGNNRIQVFDF